MKITDVTLTLFAWDDIPATTYGSHTGRFGGKSQLGLLRLITDQGLEGHAFLGPKKAPDEAYAFGFRDRMDERYDFVRTVLIALDRMTAPIYNPIRRVLPDLGALDLSPMVVLLAILIIRQAILPPLFGLV